MSPKLVIRTEANAQIGFGHYMRCRALAEAWTREVFFAGAVPHSSKAIQSPIGSRADAEELSQYAEEVGAECVVLDGYQFDDEYQRHIKQRLLVLDDYGHAKHFHADLVLNQNLGMTAELYPDAGKLLLGSRFVLLRSEFFPWRKASRAIPVEAKNILITMGGSDPGNVTLQIMLALDVAATVVVGPANPHLKILEKAKGPHTLVVNPPNLPELMTQADFAFCAGGTTCWELAYLGVPFMVSVLAENQRNNAEQLVANGIAEKFDPTRIAQLLSDPKRRSEMSEKGRALIDGEGATRVAMQLAGERIRLRPARTEDCRLLWDWANEPEARASSFSSEAIPWEDHQKWFARKLQDAECAIYIAVDEEEKFVGQIRFDGDSISVSLDKNFRGQGLGVILIQQGVRKIFKERNFATVHAWVKPANAASIKAFETCGFNRAGTETVRGHSALHFILNRK